MSGLSSEPQAATPVTGMSNKKTASFEFGPEARSLWAFEEGCTYLNHGAFGAVPNAVTEAANDWRRRIDAQPSRFMEEELPPLLRRTADTIGGYMGADGKDIVFLDNSTTAINAVLRSLVLMPGDDVLTTTHTFPAVMRTLEFVCDRADARLLQTWLPYPITDPEQAYDAVVDAITPRTRLVVIDQITSKTAIVLPLREIIEECNDRGIQVLVDGAHGPGMIQTDLNRLGATWYAGNTHKWLGSPRGSAILWTVPERQHLVRPTTISHFVAEGYTPAFDWPGTKDFSSYLSIPAAMTFRAEFGEEKIQSYCRDLAIQSGRMLASALGTERGQPDSMTAFMTTVVLPDSAGPAKPANAIALRRKLRDEFGVEVDIQALDDRLWLRVSTYVYNSIADIEVLIDALRKSGIG